MMLQFASGEPLDEGKPITDLGCCQHARLQRTVGMRSVRDRQGSPVRDREGSGEWFARSAPIARRADGACRGIKLGHVDALAKFFRV